MPSVGSAGRTERHGHKGPRQAGQATEADTGRTVHSGPVTGSDPNVKLQEQIEAVIRVLAPVLDLVFAAGEKTSRLLDRGQSGGTQVPVARDRRLPSPGASEPEPS